MDGREGTLQNVTGSKVILVKTETKVLYITLLLCLSVTITLSVKY